MAETGTDGRRRGEPRPELKDLVDGLNHQELTERNPRSSSTTDTQIAGVHFHHNLAVLDKGLNLEPGAPSWLARTKPES